MRRSEFRSASMLRTGCEPRWRVVRALFCDVKMLVHAADGSSTSGRVKSMRPNQHEGWSDTNDGSDSERNTEVVNTKT
jgi:hypothetical protein